MFSCFEGDRINSLTSTKKISGRECQGIVTFVSFRFISYYLGLLKYISSLSNQLIKDKI